MPEGKNVEVLTIQSIKGLEAQNVIIHNFLLFLQTIYKNERALFYRKIYVLLTRSRENLYISLPKNLDENLPDEIKQVVEIIKKYANLTQVLPEPEEHKKQSLA
ncbi:ATP-binding domain-containing protein [Campylobacter concisus]|uniref:ATP-binding domain-containing protein n=1 Tax=Campylobacter concisus TaxID=199 RepID=UPI00194F2338|nr:ATP-binding domain-containing protein [Campylobacter concisus]